MLSSLRNLPNGNATRVRTSQTTTGEAARPHTSSSERTADVGQRPGGWFMRRAGAYVALTKPRVVELLLVTTVPTMILAADGLPNFWLILATLVGGAGAAGSGTRGATTGMRAGSGALPGRGAPASAAPVRFRPAVHQRPRSWSPARCDRAFGGSGRGPVSWLAAARHREPLPRVPRRCTARAQPR